VVNKSTSFSLWDSCLPSLKGGKGEKRCSLYIDKRVLLLYEIWLILNDV